MVIVLMGVAGVGKTTVGELLAAELGWTFIDGDRLHPPSNVARMAAGSPLTDEDRAPWLAELHGRIRRLTEARQSAIVACSALKESYRGVLREGLEGVRFVYLHGEPRLIRERLQRRRAHFMTSDLLASQFDILEVPPEAPAFDVDQPPPRIVRAIRQALAI
jgi:gluconokinase